MANWCGSARSNYVRVKDRQAFLEWADTLPEVEVFEHDDKFALMSVGEDGWPSFRPSDDEEAIDLAAEMSQHLVPGEVFIFQQIGAEKLRYLSAWATAVNGAGETLQVSIDDIYAMVRERWNIEPSEARY